jgi:hypothetical protein
MIEPPYFEYIHRVVIDVVDIRDNRPEMRDIVFAFPRHNSNSRDSFKVRFHGKQDNRFITTFPKPHDERWNTVTARIDVPAVVLTAAAYIERVYGLVTKDFNNVPPYVRT